MYNGELEDLPAKYKKLIRLGEMFEQLRENERFTIYDYDAHIHMMIEKGERIMGQITFVEYEPKFHGKNHKILTEAFTQYDICNKSYGNLYEWMRDYFVPKWEKEREKWALTI